MSVKCIPSDIPLLYSKTRVYWGIPIFHILIQSKDCGYSLEPLRQPRQGGLNVYPESMF